MAKSLKDIQVLDEQGNPVEATALDEFADETDIVYFEVERGGKKFKFALEVHNGRVTVAHMASYRRAMAEIAVEAGEATERLGIEETETEEGTETTPEVGEDVDPLEMVSLMDMSDRYAEAEAQLLSNLVVASNYPGKNFSDPKTLCERTGAGPAARKALNIYFFGASSEPEEATGTTETAPIEKPLDSSEATDSSEVTPQTS